MQINNNYNAINFKGATGTATKNTQKLSKRVFNWTAKQCDVGTNGSLSREIFVTIASLFMLGGRVIESRSNDERREVLVRDVPGVFTAVYGAPLVNAALAYSATKKTGIPILTFKKDKKNILNANFVSQKQVKDWYSNLDKVKNPLETFSKTISKNGGNIRKVMKKLEIEDKLDKLVSNKNASNEEILAAFKKAKGNSDYTALEKSIKGLKDNNAVLKIAKTNQALVKIGGIGFTAALLGVFLPRLNIVQTRKKYMNHEAHSAVEHHNRNHTKLTKKQKEVFGSFINTKA